MAAIGTDGCLAVGCKYDRVLHKQVLAATKFLVLVEIAASGPNMHQRSIAEKLGITPQAIAKYFRQR
jgi:predicted transcriptional regulator